MPATEGHPGTEVQLLIRMAWVPFADGVLKKETLLEIHQSFFKFLRNISVIDINIRFVK